MSDRGRGFDPSVLATGDTDSGGLGLFGVRDGWPCLAGVSSLTVPQGKGRVSRDVGRDGDARGRSGRVSASVADPAAQSSDHTVVRILLVDDHIFAVRKRCVTCWPSVHSCSSSERPVTASRRWRRRSRLCRTSSSWTSPCRAWTASKTTRRIRGLLPHVRIYGLSTQEESDKLHAIEEAGADGYFSKGLAWSV